MVSALLQVHSKDFPNPSPSPQWEDKWRALKRRVVKGQWFLPPRIGPGPGKTKWNKSVLAYGYCGRVPWLLVQLPLLLLMCTRCIMHPWPPPPPRPYLLLLQRLFVNAPRSCWPDVIQKKKDKKRSKYVALDFSAHFLFFYFVSSFLLI